MRKRIYEIIEQSKEGDKLSYAYDILMLVAIVASIIPLMFVEERPVFKVIETVTVTLFIIDYVLRWITADYRSGKKGWAFALYMYSGGYPFSVPVIPVHFLGVKTDYLLRS